MADEKAASGLEDHAGYWLRYVSNHVSHAFAQKVEARGVTVAEWVLLRLMLDRGPANPSQIAAIAGMTRGTVSRLVDRLSRKKLVERTSSDVDRRYQTVALTRAGMEIMPALAQLADDNDREFFGHLKPEERASLVLLLREIVARNGWKDCPTD